MGRFDQHRNRLAKRGMQIGTQFRYLFDSGAGGIEADDLPRGGPGKARIGFLQ